MRLGVQKLMADLRLCSQLSDNRPRIAISVFDNYEQLVPDVKDNRDELRKGFNQRANKLKDSIIKYMDSNGLKEDSLLYGLVDDLNVVINTLIKKMNLKYTVAREESQGRQTAFNTVSEMQDNIDDDNDNSFLDIRPPRLRREPTSAYATPGRLGLMREMSNNSENVDIEHDLHAPPPAIVSPFRDEESQLDAFP